MAGVLVLPSGDWHISSGGFRAMAQGVANHLSDSEAASRVRAELDLAVESELYFMNLANSFDADMTKEFANALRHYSEEYEDVGAELSPTLHQGHKDRLKELLARIAK